MYDFSMAGNVLSFKSKMIKYINLDNSEKVKDYMCSAFDTFNPLHFENHPCFDIIKAGFNNTLKPRGWKCAIIKCGDEGHQFVLKSPEGDFYKSHYKNPV